MFSALRQAMGLGRKTLPERLESPRDLPEVTVKNDAGEEVELKTFMATGLWVLFFYPKAETPGCTAQACSLRDAYAKLTEHGIRVVGVSGDTVEAQQRFVQRQGLPFPLLADTHGAVRRAFGVGAIPLLGWSQREAFIIEEGKIVWHDASASTHQQAEDILTVLKR